MNPALPTQVITTMAARPERMHHMLWHMVRNDWLSFPADLRQKLADMGWEPPRPARTAWEDGYLPILTNNSGEDFLYMHRQMIAHVNGILAQVGDPNYPKIEGWMHIPAPDDPDYPVPPAWFDPTDPTAIGVLQQVKSDTFYYKRIKMWERMYTDPTFLKGMSLGELGVRPEMTIHNALHNRWSAYPGADRPDADPTQPETIDPQWDDPATTTWGTSIPATSTRFSGGCTAGWTTASMTGKRRTASSGMGFGRARGWAIWRWPNPRRPELPALCMRCWTTQSGRPSTCRRWSR